MGSLRCSEFERSLHPFLELFLGFFFLTLSWWILYFFLSGSENWSGGRVGYICGDF